MQKVTIIVPVYNMEQYLPECMDSLLAQTYRNLEILLVDDGSKDGSATMCDQYANEHESVRVIHKENGGLMSAWIAGTMEAAGEYLCYVDSDDWVEPDMIEGLMRHVSGSQKEIISSNYIIEKECGSENVIQRMPPGVYEGEQLYRDIKCHVVGEDGRLVIMSRCMKLFSAKLIRDNIRFCDKRLIMGEDVNIVLPAILESERIVIVEQGLYYHYRYVGSSMAHKYNAGLYENIRLLYQKILEILKEFEIPDAEKMARREYLSLLFLVLKNELRGNAKGCVKEIRRICKELENHAWIREYPLHPISIDGKLMYLIMKHPIRILITPIRWMLYLNDRRS